jgi:hypothetical protein
MTKIGTALAFALLLTGCPAEPQQASQSRRVALNAKPVISVYTENMGRETRGAGGPAILVAVWGDGSIVWSHDAIEGGPPYQIGRCGAESVLSLFNDLEKKGVFEDRSLERAYFGPDSRFTTIQLDDGRRRLRMQSWHELYEQHGKVVAGSHGLTALNGRSLEEVVKTEPEPYQKYRRTWSELRSRLAGLIPGAGEALDPGQQIRLK